MHDMFVEYYGGSEWYDKQYRIRQVYFKKDNEYECYYSGRLSSDGKMEGVGKYMKIYVNKVEQDFGQCYYGEFRKDRKNGEGYLVSTSIYSNEVYAYSGQFGKDKREGKGKQVDPFNNLYIG